MTDRDIQYQQERAAVLAALTDEWQTIQEIKEGAQLTTGSLKSAGYYLQSLQVKGEAVSKRGTQLFFDGTRPSSWRRPQEFTFNISIKAVYSPGNVQMFLNDTVSHVSVAQNIRRSVTKAIRDGGALDLVLTDHPNIRPLSYDVRVTEGRS